LTDGADALGERGVTRLGIAVVTYNRLERLRQTVKAVQRYCRAPYVLVVAEDGGTDGTRAWCARAGVRVISGANRGVCWNKNRGLFALAALGCDPILLLEDDTYPTAAGWEREWIEGTRRWHHLSFLQRWVEKYILAGAGTAADPYVVAKVTAQCNSISAEALRVVGFHDSRFRGFGSGHAEWTSRVKLAGYGFKDVTRPDGEVKHGSLFIRGGLVSPPAPSWRNEGDVERNKLVWQAIKGEPPFRYAWRGAEERAEFLDEQQRAGTDLSRIAPELVDAGARLEPDPRGRLEPARPRGRWRKVAQFLLRRTSSSGADHG
jgi:glycosyltransferase involved in cell wall biosynthesis